jgi:hypothetical protein
MADNTVKCTTPIENLTSAQINMIEPRLRPHAWSDIGFMGETERLLEIYHKDKHILDDAKITFSQIADLLSLFHERGVYSNTLSDSDTLPDSHTLSENNKAPQRKWFRVSEHILFSYREIQTRGYQECPFVIDKETDEIYEDTGLIFDLKNEKTGEYVRLNTLHIHMIKHHHFFEGYDTKYRLDPRKVIDVLEINPNSTSGYSISKCDDLLWKFNAFYNRNRKK